MRLTTKKILAREFLILIFLTLFSIICGLLTFPYNTFRKLQIYSINKEIYSQKGKMDSLSTSYNKKLINQKNFYNESFEALSAEYQLDSSEATWNDLTKSYIADSIIYFYENKWDKKVVKFLQSKGFNNGETFKKFVGENIFSKNDSINYSRSKKIEMKILELKNQSNIYNNKILSFKEQLNISFLIFMILFSIAFPIRFLILGIKWSIETIKLKE
jgi:hypothetical protein